MSTHTTPQDDDSWKGRLAFLWREINGFLDEVAEHRTQGVSVLGMPTVRERNRRVSVRMRVEGEPMPAEWVEQVRDIVSRARSLLDNLMWSAVHRDPAVEFTPKQERAIYFPVASTAAVWQSFESSAHGAVLTDVQREALKAIQPFMSGSQVVGWLSDVNNYDKHRAPLKLQVMPDRLFVFYPDVDFGKRGRGTSRFVLADPLLPVGNRHLGDFYSEHPVTTARPFEIPTALCIRIGEDWVDVQDFFWDVLELVVHASEVLVTGDTGVARAVKRLLSHRRLQLDAFRKVFEGDVIADAIWRSMSPDNATEWSPGLRLGGAHSSASLRRVPGHVQT